MFACPECNAAMRGTTADLETDEEESDVERTLTCKDCGNEIRSEL